MGANISNIICSKRVYLEGEASYRLSANLANCDKGSPSIKGGNIGWLSNSACNRPKPDVFHKWGDDMRRINTWTISSQLKKRKTEKGKGKGKHLKIKKNGLGELLNTWNSEEWIHS